MSAWYPLATRVVGHDAGSFVGGPYRGVLHTTEGDSIAGAEAAYRKNDSWPHFTVQSSTVHQHIPIDRAARSLMHPAGTVDTNRLSAIQIELVGHAHTPPAGDALRGLRDLMRWIEAQTGIRPACWPLKPYPESAGVSNGVRMSDAAWQTWDAWCGHQNVPHNDHGDPGALDVAYLFAGIRSDTTPFVTGPTVEIDMKLKLVKIPITTGDQGEANVPVAIPIDDIVSIVGPGLRPNSDHRYLEVKTGVADEDGHTVLSTEGWAPHQPETVRLWVIDHT